MSRQINVKGLLKLNACCVGASVLLTACGLYKGSLWATCFGLFSLCSETITLWGCMRLNTQNTDVNHNTKSSK